MATAKELLIAARKLIEKPENWTQGVMARDYEGYGTFPTFDDAFCFCAVGALKRAAEWGGFVTTELFLANYISVNHGFNSIETFNDFSTHDEVLKAFDHAIEIAE